ncbi:short chain dehydrogenase/reductase SDR [Decorospora gaudefroyi]|uniref:3beta-hydroxysteroid 3-dehydrogenase n=1 Tax=Decorospora gaudefroyi TaxID=184978 RepID=A0A6A5JZL1_9PLEO|nr:short chain dehydrogenase/reductase SDR [Decorospora gaudefroyi]
MAGSILITGSNGSLALPAVKYLLEAYPSFTLLLTVRDDSPQDINTTELRRLLAHHPHASASILKLDLSSLANVHKFSDALLSEIQAGSLPRLRAIICNAMSWSLSGPAKYSKEGYELSTAINHLAHFSLCLRLLRGMDRMRGRIVFVGSAAHWPDRARLSRGFPTQIPKELELLVHPQPDAEGEEMGRGFQRYGTSKLVAVMVMYEFNNRLRANKDTESIRAVVVDPLDLVNSRAFFQPHVPGHFQIVVSVMNWLLPLLGRIAPRFVTVEAAAKPVVEVAVADRFEGQEGYFEGEIKAESSPDSRDGEVQKALWRKSVEWCGLEGGDIIIDV